MTSDWAQVWIGIVGLLGLATTVHFARKAWKEAQSTNLQAREQFVAERRAWCAIEILGPIVEVERDIVKCMARIHAKNVGQTPAQRVEFNASRWDTKPDEKWLAGEIDKARIVPASAGITIFPNQFQPYYATRQFDGTALSLGTKFAYLHGWVSYWTAGDAKRHFTPFIVKYECEIREQGSIQSSMSTTHTIGLPAD